MVQIVKVLYLQISLKLVMCQSLKQKTEIHQNFCNRQYKKIFFPQNAKPPIRFYPKN